MTPAEFVAKWKDVDFGEKQASQEMFLDICRVVEHPTPVEFGNKDAFTFEKSVPGGFADAYLEEHFGWEFKGKDGDLDEALGQLLRYSVYLKTPPLLIVSSFKTIRIRTNFPGMETVLHEFPVESIGEPENLRILRCAFHAPADLRPNRSVEDVTKETANLFMHIVSDMEEQDEDPEKLARFLNQIVFCLYAEDAGLLPGKMFTDLVTQQFKDPKQFNQAIGNLFQQMATGGLFGPTTIPHFNGDLFNESETVELSTVALQRLAEATSKNWQNIEPSIFGTLFERALDASKRSQLGAHYTSAEDIMLVVEPVVMIPLRREWEEARGEINGFIDDDNHTAARGRLEAFQERLSGVKVLDPACGSGNFLYLTLRSLLDQEKEAIDFGAAQGWYDLRPTVKPDQMLGLEINPYATELARTSLWIGYIQWHQVNGFSYNHSPILTSLDAIEQRDAILDLTDPENPKEPEWPEAEFIVGNPPFLGGKLLRTNLGDQYVDCLFGTYRKRVPAEAYLVCYWFEKGRFELEEHGAKRVGLLATQGIRGGASRRVLQRIKRSGDIFMAWSDQPWILDGAAVHTSIIGFDNGAEVERNLDGESTESINANLTSGMDLTQAARLEANIGTAFMGNTKGGPFDISYILAQEMLESPNPNGKSNSEVIKPWINGKDITSRPGEKWIVDFGELDVGDAALFEAPFEYVKARVLPSRENNRRRRYADKWWQHVEPRPGLRSAVEGLCRYVATPRVSKHRLFKWIDGKVVTDSACIALASDEDYFFGILHSRLHELWALAMGTQLREVESGFRYTPTTCFETFPFPEPTDEQRDAISEVARRLNELREGWLNPPGMPESELKKRTLTNLYNARPTWLDNVHRELDAAVAAAYGWPADLGEQEILERLLALNLERAAAQ